MGETSWVRSSEASSPCPERQPEPGPSAGDGCCNLTRPEVTLTRKGRWCFGARVPQTQQDPNLVPSFFIESSKIKTPLSVGTSRLCEQGLGVAEGWRGSGGLRPRHWQRKRQEKAELGKGKGTVTHIPCPRDCPRAPELPQSPLSTHGHREPPLITPQHLNSEPLGYFKSKPCASHTIRWY